MAKKDRDATEGYVQHGVSFAGSTASGQAVGMCPFCGKEKHFYVNKVTGAWDCKRCTTGGGLLTFLQQKAEHNQPKFRGKVAMQLADNRTLSRRTLRAWGVGWDGKHYTVPVQAFDKTVDLRRYLMRSNKMFATTGSKVGLVGKDNGSKDVWLCEGEWDAMALWECFQQLDINDSVLAVVGASSFPKNAVDHFQNRNVCVLFDNDDAGSKGAVRVNNMLEGFCKSLQFVHWPERFEKGYDIRDLYKAKGKNLVSAIKKMFKPTPPGALQEPETSERPTGDGLLEFIAIKGYREWLHLPDADVLAVMFGAVFANRFDGDPLWLFFVDGPGGGKTELLMSMSGAPLIMTTTSLTPHTLISGANFAGAGDPSVIPKLDGKVLVVKDFTTILNMNAMQRDEIFGVLRDAYDGKTEKYFGNGVHRSYESHFGILAGVTPVIEAYASQSSVLGERFLKYRFPHEDTVTKGDLAIDRALDNIAGESAMREELMAVASQVLDLDVSATKPPILPQEYKTKIKGLAQWLSVLRGVVQRDRYTGQVLSKPVKEVGTRLAKQLAKLAMGVAVYRRKKQVDESCYRIVVDVARGTAPERVEEIVKQLYLNHSYGTMPTRKLAKFSRFPAETVLAVLQDLEMLKLVKLVEQGRYPEWSIAPAVRKLMAPLDLYGKDTKKKRKPARRTKIA